MTWRTGIIFLVGCVIVGYLIGLAATKASAMPAPTCDAGCTSPVHTRREGARKYRHHHLGHVQSNVHYPRHAKRVILDALMAAQARMPARATGFSRRLTRAAMWRNFTSHDHCFFEVSPSPPNSATWTCQPGHYQRWVDNADWRPADVRALICGGIAGISVGGALSSGASAGPAAPWIWGGIGAGWAACQWGPVLESLAGN
ncbi:MAG: hypothetical protein HOV66_19775 [Streptomycetaceae bacterium]|nr:hypothetical protein [Streptomycetaceae bacterium]